MRNRVAVCAGLNAWESSCLKKAKTHWIIRHRVARTRCNGRGARLFIRKLKVLELRDMRQKMEKVQENGECRLCIIKQGWTVVDEGDRKVMKGASGWKYD